MNQASNPRNRRLISKFVLSALIFMAVGVNAGEASAATYSVTPNQNFYFSLVSSTSVVFYTSNNGSVDPDLYLYNLQGTQLAYDYDSAGSLNSRISITLPAGDYRLYATYYQTWGLYTLNSAFNLSTIATSTTTTTTTTVAPITTTTVPVTAPTVLWASVPSGSVSSSFTVKASATSAVTTATITKWCLTLDGGFPTSNLSVYDSSYYGLYYYGYYSAGTGCWSSSYSSLTSGAFTINPSAMTNGSHTLALVVYDSRSVASVAASTTFTVAVAVPTVSWVSIPSWSVSSPFTVKASAASGTSSATITKWCLTLDGVVPTSNLSVYDSTYSRVNTSGVYTASTGCWSSSYTSLTSGAFTVNPSALTNGPHTLTLIAYDSRPAASVATSTTFTVAIPVPTIKPVAVASPKKKVATPKKKVVVTLPPKKKVAAVMIPKVVGMTKSIAVKALQAKKMKAQVKIDSKCRAKLSANLEKWRVVRQVNLVLFICK